MSRTIALCSTLVALALWGCGGGGGPSSTGNALDSGRARLDRVASGEQPATAPSLQSILDLFLQAVRADPASSQAHFGAAVCMAGAVALEADETTTAPEPPLPAATSGGGVVRPGAGPGGTDDGTAPPMPPGHTEPGRPMPPHRTFGLLWRLDSGLANPYALLHMLAPIGEMRFGMLGYFGDDTEDAARRLRMLARLGTVVEHLEKVETDPAFTTTLRIGPDRTVTVGLPEVYLFDAYVNSLRARLALSLAYVRGASGWSPPVFAGGGGVSVGGGGGTGAFPRPGWLDPNGDGKMTPDEYLPSDPFLTLRDPALLATAKQAMLATAEKAAKGIEGALARTEDGFLIPNTPETREALAEVRDHVLPLIRQAAIGPVTVEIPRPVPMLMPDMPGRPGHPQPGDGSPAVETLTFNLAAWFRNPPSDLKDFAPTIPFGTEGWPLFEQAVYPDPTFGGLFPKGLPKDGWPW